jgi:hypothetical protein
MSQYQTSFGFELEGENKKRPNKPNSALLSVLDEAATSTFGPGARVVVYSGQEDPGEQYGSIRHKTGLAADIRVFRPDGSRVRLADEDAGLFAANAKRSGIRGFGAGASYMGDAFHVDLFPEEEYTEDMGPVWGDWAAKRRDMLLEARAEGTEAYNALLDQLGSNDQRTDAARRAQYGLGDRDPGTTADVLQAVKRGDMTKDEAGKYVSEELLSGVEGASAYDILQDQREEEKQGMAMLGQGLEMLAGSDVPAAPRARSLPMRLSPGRTSATPGAQAIGRLGLESLLANNPLLGIR